MQVINILTIGEQDGPGKGGFFPQGFVGRINTAANYDKMADGYEVCNCVHGCPSTAHTGTLFLWHFAIDVVHCYAFHSCAFRSLFFVLCYCQEFPFPATVQIAVSLHSICYVKDLPQELA